MTGRITNADVMRSQEAMIERLAGLVEAFLTKPSRISDEKVSLRRNAKGETQPEVECVRQEGETFVETIERARSEYERLCARFPMSEGTTYAAPLGNSAVDPEKTARAAAAIARARTK